MADFIYVVYSQAFEYIGRAKKKVQDFFYKYIKIC